MNAISKATQIVPPCIIDVEASGFGPDSYPIEIGVALDDGEKYCTLILPAESWTHWDESAEAVHRIPRDILQEYGRPMHDVIAELNQRLNGRTVYTDGWVVDSTWLRKLFDHCGQTPSFHTSSLEMILKPAQMEIWHETKDRIVQEMNLQRHRASYDALIIQKTWLETKSVA